MIEHSSFSPEHEKAITVAFEDCLRALGLTDRPSDPVVLVIARRIIELAKQGECNPALLRDGAGRGTDDAYGHVLLCSGSRDGSHNSGARDTAASMTA